MAYLKLTDALIQRASANLRDTVAQTLSQGMSAIGNRTAQAAGTGAITETTQETATKANAAQKAINAPQQTLDKAKPITSQAVQSITPQTQKPTDKKVQSPDNKSQPGFLPNLLTSISNIPNKITGIFSPKPAPAAA